MLSSWVDRIVQSNDPARTLLDVRGEIDLADGFREAGLPGIMTTPRYESSSHIRKEIGPASGRDDILMERASYVVRIGMACSFNCFSE